MTLVKGTGGRTVASIISGKWRACCLIALVSEFVYNDIDLPTRPRSLPVAQKVIASLKHVQIATNSWNHVHPEMCNSYFTGPKDLLPGESSGLLNCP